eukprot:Phypoly_transcript_04286.p1 GENE.Phypoly_transcript_04286~~Phypoly_transcript_04286.p1  ORF type:complete len:707 (+),score=83.00 Phypoly_transcript_04286:28-2148(+)
MQIFWVGILFICFVAAQSPDFYVVYERTLTSLQPTKDQLSDLVANATEYANTLQSNGTWPDIDYNDPNPAVWPSCFHLNPRLLTMTTAYVTPNQPLYNSSTLYSKIELALNFWLDKDPMNSNWWYNDIGVPTPLGEICVQINKTLTLSQRQTAVSFMNRAFTNGATGANYLWMAYVYILKSLMTGNETELKTNIAGSFGQVVLAPGQAEGIKQDGSFFQHAMQIYNGGYGESFAETVLELVFMTANTTFSLDPATLSVWSLFLLDGTQWMDNFGYWDYSVRGREVTRPISYFLGFTPEYVAATTGPRHAEWEEFAERITNRTFSPLVGNKHFWIADYMVHHREHFSASVKMYSTRTYNAECVNDEGANSLHLSDGVLNVYQTGNEFVWVFPVWDWQRIPGITCAIGEVASECATVKQLGKTTFVGGVSDGMYGAAVFDFKAPLNGTLSARKSWFFFDTEIVALGANITSRTSNPIVTSINQCLLRSEVYVSGSNDPLPPANKTFDDITWILHDGVGYIFPGGPISVGISNTVVNGSWNQIGQYTGDVSEGVFSAWINHPTNKGGSYQYVIVPGVTLAILQSSANKTISDLVILENSPNLQAVLNTKSQVLQAVFWEVGTLNGGPYTISVSSPCAIIVSVDSSSNMVNTTISDPTQLLTGTVKVSIHMNLSGTNCAYNNDGTSTLLFQLPSGAFAGSSTSVLCKLEQ